MHKLTIFSRHPEFMNKMLLPYDIDGEKVVGAYGNEPYAILVENDSHRRIEVRISIDGTDIATGKPATTSVEGERWSIAPRSRMILEAWPETQQGGARFVFAETGKSVALHTHGNTRDVGIIAAAIFCEPPGADFAGFGGDILRSYTPPATLGAPMRGAGPLEVQTMSNTKSMPAREYTDTGATRSAAATGAGEYAKQEIRYVEGLRNPVFTEILRVRYLWWDELTAKLGAKGISSSAMGSTPGFPGDRPFKGVDLGATPRPHQAPVASTHQPTYQRVS